MSARFDRARIQGYYDRNTAIFAAVGEGGDEGAIHRAVWGPGVTAPQQAFHYVDERVAALARRAAPAGAAHVVDLGCGVGASLCYLAARLPIRGTGVTLSPAQAALARGRIARAGLADRVTCREADYTDLPADIPAADVAFAIESFVHAPDAAAFFAQCARLIRPGGWLAICDDVRRASGDRRAEAAIDRYRRGWHVNTLLTAAELRAAAAAAGFTVESTEDLTPYLGLGRLRDRVLEAAMAAARWLPGRWPRLDPWLGGTALHTCLSRRWIGYELVVFTRAGSSGAAGATGAAGAVQRVP